MKYMEICYSKKDRGHIFPKNKRDLFHSSYIGTQYTSVFDYTKDVCTYIDSTGSLKGYTGPVSCDWFPFDFDGDTALEDTRTLFEYATTSMENTEGAYAAFSGSKGFHLYVRTSKFREPSKQTCRRMKAAAKTLKEKLHLETLDLALYKTTGIIRTTNSKHERTGLFKIPLFALELYTCSMDDIRKYAEKKRSLRDRTTIRRRSRG